MLDTSISLYYHDVILAIVKVSTPSLVIALTLVIYLVGTHYECSLPPVEIEWGDKSGSSLETLTPDHMPDKKAAFNEPIKTKNSVPQVENDVLFLNTFADFINTVEADIGPSTSDPTLKIERIFTGINGSSNMAFLGANDILVLERVTGKVQRIVDGDMSKRPLIDLNSYHQDGLLGIAISKKQNGSIYVFLYLNEAPQKYGDDVDTKEEAQKVNRTLGYDREGDRLYRYKLVGNKLVQQKLLFTLPVPEPNSHLGGQHRGGEVIIGPNTGVYFVIGNLDGKKYDEKTKAQNYENGAEPDGRAGILRLTQDGKPIGKGIIGDTYPLNLYYAYGIRNSFGMDFDPITGNLWDTENGPDHGDEINLVEPGFNSGDDKLLGMSGHDDKIKGLVDFDGRGKYSDPEFTWTFPVGPTALKFFNSDKFGPEYKNDMFVADWNNGNIYHFDLNNDRTSLLLHGKLRDKIADTPDEPEDLIFAKGFKGITDLQVSPEGYLYILSDGDIFRILPKNSHTNAVK